MARIRTIKPEFWTDEKVVQLPFEARLLFIGLWNFADDSGAVEFSPDRLRMLIFPGDPTLDVSGLIDLLAAADLIQYLVADQEIKAISINNWSKHQKIDNPSRKTIVREGYRKVTIPSEHRIAVAKKYGCQPGTPCSATCYYCGMPGTIHWWLRSDGKPGRWVSLSYLEFDHFYAEFSGGENHCNNLVLACRACNRGKREKSPHVFLEAKHPQLAVDSPREDSPMEGKGKEGKGEEEPHRYRFAGKVIRLTDEDFTRWQRTFHAIPDFNAELTAIDTKFAADPPRDWYATLSGWLSKKHERLLLQRGNTPPGVPKGDYAKSNVQTIR